MLIAWLLKKKDLFRESSIDNLRDSLNSFRIDSAIRFDLSFDLTRTSSMILYLCLTLSLDHYTLSILIILLTDDHLISFFFSRSISCWDLAWYEIYWTRKQTTTWSDRLLSFRWWINILGWSFFDSSFLWFNVSASICALFSYDIASWWWDQLHSCYLQKSVRIDYLEIEISIREEIFWFRSLS